MDINNFDEYIYSHSEENIESDDSIESFISKNSRRGKTHKTPATSNVITITGKKVSEIVDAIINGKFTDYRNPTDFRGRYRTERIQNGIVRSVRNKSVPFTRDNYPIVSGKVVVNGYSFSYTYIGESCVWALEKDGKRFVFHVIDSQPYNLSPKLKEGDGKCKFGAYNGRRYHKDLVEVLDMFVLKSPGTTDFMQPDDYEFVF